QPFKGVRNVVNGLAYRFPDGAQLASAIGAFLGDWVGTKDFLVRVVLGKDPSCLVNTSERLGLVLAVVGNDADGVGAFSFVFEHPNEEQLRIKPWVQLLEEFLRFDPSADVKVELVAPNEVLYAWP